MTAYVQYAEPYPASRGDRFGATAGRARPHRGQDTAPGGLPALAVADGTFVGAKWDPALGNVVAIAHADGMFSGYAHLAHVRGVVAGQQVGRLGGFALLGATGTAQKGRHLHYTIGLDPWGVISGRVQDPLEWINGHLGPQTQQGSGEGSGDWYSAAAIDGMPGHVLYQMMQLWAREGGYAGPIDGDLGVNSWKGIQTVLAGHNGYTGLVDGKPGKLTWAAVQRAAMHGGYRGPDDGVMGANSWRGLATLLNAKF